MNQIIRSPQGAPAFGERNGDWIWNGVTWVCSPCNDMGPPGPPCPPPGWPPPGCPPWFSGANSPPWYPGANAGVSFGTTPPPNPVRGHFWWDGTTMWLFDGAAWSGIGGPGTGANAFVGSSPPSNPNVGTLWFDGNALLVWNGTTWAVSGGGTSTGANPPSNPQPGQQWWNGATLFIWDGNAWVPTSQTKSYVQATPPPSPNPGDTWWDGSVMRIWSGTAWMLVGPGGTVGPVGTTTPVFRIANPTASSVPANTWEIFPVSGIPTLDTQNGWNVSTKQWRPNIAGSYLINTLVWWSSTGYFAACLKNDNGGPFPDLTTQNVVTVLGAFVPGSGETSYQSNMGIVQMNGSTDFLRMWVYSVTGAVFQSFSGPLWSATLLT